MYEYLKDCERGYAIPIKKVRQYPGITAEKLAELLGSFHPPQGYTLIDRHPTLPAVCDTLASSKVVQEMTVHHPAPVP